jgi:hypothetical protein
MHRIDFIGRRIACEKGREFHKNEPGMRPAIPTPRTAVHEATTDATATSMPSP